MHKAQGINTGAVLNESGVLPVLVAAPPLVPAGPGLGGEVAAVSAVEVRVRLLGDGRGTTRPHRRIYLTAHLTAPDASGVGLDKV